MAGVRYAELLLLCEAAKGPRRFPFGAKSRALPVALISFDGLIDVTQNRQAAA
jgi:hypothetical protein